MSYPVVIDEVGTIGRVLDGYSLARFGDGELKMSFGAGYSRQQGSETLAAELTRVCRQPNMRLIVGVPTMDPLGPKYQNWLRHKPRFEELLHPDVQYYSAFVTRPDSAPWIATADYARSVESIWRGKRVAVVCERKGSIFRAVKPAARQVVHVECPRVGAYDVIDRLEEMVLWTLPDVCVMSAGPAATCLAERLSAQGLQAVDLGSIGRLITRTLYDD